MMQDNTNFLESSMKNTKDTHWEQHNNFQINGDSTFPLNRQILFTNKAAAPKIKEINFLGYKENKLRLHVKFKTEALRRAFINLSFNESWSREVSAFSNGQSAYYDPRSQAELDGIVKLINQFDPLDEDILKELPSILNTRVNRHQEPSTSYPVFDGTLVGTGNGFSIDNSLSYALEVQGGGIPSLHDFEKKKSAAEKLSYTAQEINSYYQNPNIAQVAPHEKDKLPAQHDGYYLIAMYESSKGTVYINGKKYYQTSDYHFVRQNNDGLFSHRRGTGYSPMQKDSQEQPITIPEQAKLFYPFEDGSYSYDEHFQEIPVCADYTFIGYMYIQVVSNRLNNVPQESYRILDELESKAKSSPKINELLTNFKKEFFLYPPQPEFFSDAREKIADFYQQVLAVERPEVKQTGGGQSYIDRLYRFFSEDTISATDADKEASSDVVVKYV